MFRQNLLDSILQYLREDGMALLGKAAAASGIFLVGLIVIKRIVNNIKARVRANSLTQDQYSLKMANTIGSMIFVALMIFNVLLVFGFLGLEVALIIGAISIALGFAMETTIKNMISGIFLLTNKKNKLGDTVEVMGSYNFRGKIESITLRHTIFALIDNRKVIIPNGALADTPIKTYKNEPLIRGKIELKVPRHVQLNQVKNLVLSAINAHPNVLNKNYSSLMVSSFDAHGIGLAGYYYLSPSMGKPDFVINSDLRTTISNTFKTYGIAAPYLNIVVDVGG